MGKKKLYTMSVESGLISTENYVNDPLPDNDIEGEVLTAEEWSICDNLSTECFKGIDAIGMLQKQYKINTEAISGKCDMSIVQSSNETMSYCAGLLGINKKDMKKYTVSTESHIGPRQTLVLSNEFISDFVNSIIEAIKKAWASIVNWFKTMWVKILAWWMKLTTYFTNVLSDITQIQLTECLRLRPETFSKLLDLQQLIKFKMYGYDGKGKEPPVIIEDPYRITRILNLTREYLNTVDNRLKYGYLVCNLEIEKTNIIRIDTPHYHDVLLKHNFFDLYDINLNSDDFVAALLYATPDKAKILVYNKSSKLSEVKEGERKESSRYKYTGKDDELKNFKRDDFKTLAGLIVDKQRSVNKEINAAIDLIGEKKEQMIKELQEAGNDDNGVYALKLKALSTVVVDGAREMMDNLKYLVSIFKDIRIDFATSSDLFYDDLYKKIKTDKEYANYWNEYMNKMGKNSKELYDLNTLKLKKIDGMYYFEVRYHGNYLRRHNACCVFPKANLNIYTQDNTSNVIKKTVTVNRQINLPRVVLMSDVWNRVTSRFVYYHELGHQLMNDGTDTRSIWIDPSVFADNKDELLAILEKGEITEDDIDNMDRIMKDKKCAAPMLDTMFLYSFNTIELRADAYAILKTNGFSIQKFLLRNPIQNPGRLFFPNIYNNLLTNEINYIKQYVTPSTVEAIKSFILPSRRKEYIPKDMSFGLPKVFANHMDYLKEINDKFIECSREKKILEFIKWLWTNFKDNSDGTKILKKGVDY